MVLFEYPQHMFWLRNKKIIFCYALLSKGLLTWIFLGLVKLYPCHAEYVYISTKLLPIFIIKSALKSPAISVHLQAG